MCMPLYRAFVTTAPKMITAPKIMSGLQVALGLALLIAPAIADDQPPRPVAALRYVPGSSIKLEQLVGDYDKHLKKETRNRTWSRFGVRGTDLGQSFEHQGKLLFLFGDTMGPGDGDCLATSLSTDPEAGLELNFLRWNGHYLKIAPPGISMAGFEVPTGGISLQGQAYLFCTTDHSSEQVMGRSLLVRFDPTTKRFETVRNISEKARQLHQCRRAPRADRDAQDYRKRTRPKRFSCGEAVRIGGATRIWHVSPLEKSNRAQPRSILPAWMVKETRSGARTSCRQSRWCSIQ